MIIYELCTNLVEVKGIVNIIFVVLAVSGSVCAQTISGTTSALLITPITITKNVDLNFGNIAVSSSTGGTVVLTPGGSRTSGGSGGVTLPAITGTVTAADFTVFGQPSYTYSITLPSSVAISDGFSHTMTITAFTSSPSTTGLLSTAGLQDLTIGATLNVSASQTSGAYTNATAIPVTVNYN